MSLSYCTRCKTFKDITNFYTHRDRRDSTTRLRSQCKECNKISNKSRPNRGGWSKWKEVRVHSLRILDSNEIIDRIKWVNHLLKKSTNRHKDKRTNLESIDISKLVLPDYCPYLGVKLQYHAMVGCRVIHDQASLDRIDSTKGYESGNIQIISRLANCMKYNSTEEQLVTFAKNVLRLHDINPLTQILEDPI